MHPYQRARARIDSRLAGFLKKSLPCFLFVFVSMVVAVLLSPTQAAPKDACVKALIEIESKAPYAYKGLTPEGVKRLEEARDAVRQRFQQFPAIFMKMETLHQLLTVARIAKMHGFIYGPPGGAKTKVLDWFGDGEEVFKKQLNPMMSEMPLTGGLNFDAARQGREEINTTGTLVDHKLAYLDEIEKANPAVLAALLRVINEREVTVGGKVVKADLETMFATSNAMLPEILEHFVLSGQATSGQAFLNRLHFKAMVYNWLDANSQALLDTRNNRMRFLKQAAKSNPAVLKDELFQETAYPDWESLRQLAFSMFTVSPELDAVARDFVNDLRAKTNQAIRESEEEHRNDPTGHPYVYTPSFDFTERLRQTITDVVVVSAFVDFLKSPLADAKNLKKLSEKQIVLDPLSLWRSFLILTTVGPGEVKLDFGGKKGNRGLPTIDFGVNVSDLKTTARDTREQSLLDYIQQEQRRFADTLAAVLEKYNVAIEDSARLGGVDALTDGKADFEEVLHAATSH